MADTVNLPSGSNFDPYPIPIGASPGTYALLLKKSGYADWTKGGVEVPLDHAGGCQPGTVSLEALIQELP
ncbi:MAG TPA: hypothetical protein VHE78_13510 [Gemmatimonadaceae bacterium]|nr:hypothetical protein [Gemmatimonadaceae bacterium]